MQASLRKWLTISLLNLLLVATLGVLMRYKIAFYLPFIQQKFVLHSHSHFAFSGWITQTLMVLMVHHLALKNGEGVFGKYRWLLWANLITSYGMLLSFLFQGYAFFSISFSTLCIFVSYVFAVYYWKDLNRLTAETNSKRWFKAGLVFSVLSSVGAFSLAYMMANKITHQNWYLACIYFFLHFQYNGWFFFAGMGLLVSRLEPLIADVKKLQLVFLLFCLACVPAYFLSALWLPLPIVANVCIVAAVIAQLAGWILLLQCISRTRAISGSHFGPHGRIIFILVSIAFSIKLLLQACSVHPALSTLSYSFRPIVIGYLHLVLLAVTSLFLIGFMVAFKLMQVTKLLSTGIYIFIAGIVLNELILMIQGVAAFSYNSVPQINLLLLAAALVLWVGISVMFISRFGKK